jgi:hypothetical protein
MLTWQSSSKYENSLSYFYCLIKLFKVILQCFGIFDLPHRDHASINLFTVPRKRNDLPKVLYLCRSYFWSLTIHVPYLNTPFLPDLILDWLLADLKQERLKVVSFVLWAWRFMPPNFFTYSPADSLSFTTLELKRLFRVQRWLLPSAVWFQVLCIVFA